MKKLADAVKEAGSFLERLAPDQDNLDIILLNWRDYPPLTLGTLRALHELGADITRCAELFPEAGLAQATGGQR